MFTVLRDWGASENPGHRLVETTERLLVSFAMGSLVVIKRRIELT